MFKFPDGRYKSIGQGAVFFKFGARNDLNMALESPKMAKIVKNIFPAWYTQAMSGKGPRSSELKSKKITLGLFIFPDLFRGRVSFQFRLFSLCICC